MKSANTLFIAILVMIGCNSKAQNVLDDLTAKEKAQKLYVPYPPLREADVMWSKRIWRTIDLREKINHPLYFPTTEINNRKSLFSVIKSGVESGQITAYANPVMDDEFKLPLTKSELQNILTRIENFTRENIETGEMEPFIDTIEIASADIKQYWIKEDWFFDKQRSVMDVRIVGICPLMESKTESGEFRGYKPLFWIYYPECRPIFAKAEAYNRKNDFERRSFDEIFIKRQFGSYIRKESNVYDRSIAEYTTGLDALLESEKIKEDVFLFEQDMWLY